MEQTILISALLFAVVLSSWLVVSEAKRGRGSSFSYGSVTARVEVSIS